ncbi:VIT1/CCC1 transporter family protein [Rugosimonospora africana]|uniref:VIT1/CCC1 transporter family protein n=1 Tax=Rugosimonospora africana TaxID=556532 RepID=UPI0019437258|nr:VIT family protein [Rugosimonospora africana]
MGNSAGPGAVQPHPGEPHFGGFASRLNWLRAGVLGADDGIVSIAGIVTGVAGATMARGPILTAGIAGLFAGAISMALGEYVSVSSQRDTERALLDKERAELAEAPGQELAELTALYQAKGLSAQTARTVAEELTRHDAFAAHVEVELGIDPGALTNPWQAATASAAAFTIGALLPLVAVLAPPTSWRVPVTFVAVLVALAVTGEVSARLGGTSRRAAVARVVIGGALGMLVTYGIGHLVHSAGI